MRKLRTSTAPKFDAEMSDFSSGILTCPRCASTYLHQGAVDIYRRPNEIVSEGLHVRTSGPNIEPNVTVDRDLNGNPSTYRDGLIIDFYCEECCSDFTKSRPLQLQIFQEEGWTYLSWSPAMFEDEEV